MLLKGTTRKIISQEKGLLNFLGPFMKNVLMPLAKNILTPLGLMVAISATDPPIQKKIYELEEPPLII